MLGMEQERLGVRYKRLILGEESGMNEDQSDTLQRAACGLAELAVQVEGSAPVWLRGRSEWLRNEAGLGGAGQPSKCMSDEQCSFVEKVLSVLGDEVRAPEEVDDMRHEWERIQNTCMELIDQAPEH
jgi:hypothetical protein